MEITMKEILERLAISPSGFTFDPRTGRSFTLNTTGMAVVHQMREGFSLQQIVHNLSGEYEQSPERVEASLEQFTIHLKRCLK